MALTFSGGLGSNTASTNPVSAFWGTSQPVSVLIVCLKTLGATNRAGGAPNYMGVDLIQANTTQKAAASPESSAEIWYMTNPPHSPAADPNIIIPNTGLAAVHYDIIGAKAQLGMTAAFEAAGGSNGTSVNPTTGAIVTTKDGCFGVGLVVSGAQTWAPSATTGTILTNVDDGSDGYGEAYTEQVSAGSFTFTWTFATSEDWGAVGVFFKEVADPDVQLNNYQSVSSVSAGVISTVGGIR